MACELCGYEGKPIPIWDKNQREKNKILYSKVIRDENNRIINAANCICPNCGLVHTIPKMDRERCKKFYEKEYRETYGLIPEVEYRHAKTALNYLNETKTLRIPFLDVGASTGKLVELVRNIAPKEYNNRIYGIDAAQENEYVKKIEIEDYEPEEKLACVTMLNTLEHMYSPVTILKKIHNIMLDNGVLLVSVPDILNMNVKIPMDPYLSNAHLYTFSENTLSLMLAKCGFQVLQIVQITEEIGDKLYFLCRKVEPMEVKYRKPNIEYYKAFLEAVNNVFVLKYNIMRG